MTPAADDFKCLLRFNRRVWRRVFPWVVGTAAALAVAGLLGVLRWHWAVWVIVGLALFQGSGMAVTALCGLRLPEIVRRREARERRRAAAVG